MVRSILRTVLRAFRALEREFFPPPAPPTPQPKPKPGPTPTPPPIASTRRRVAILGGGVGAMTTAYELSKTPELQQRYELTVYQLGWRLGGKGASGRNAAMGQRIEEHGLHIWMGHYENAFALIRDVYDRLGRQPEQPLATWRDAFTKHSYIVLGETPEQTGHGWQLWPFDFPTNSAEPGVGGLIPGPFTLLQDLLGALRKLLAKELPHGMWDLYSFDAGGPGYPGWVGAELGRVEAEARAAGRAVVDAVEAVLPPQLRALGDAHALIRELSPDAREHRATSHQTLLYLVDRACASVDDAAATADHESDELRRLRLAVELYTAVFRGILRDGVLLHGFDVLDRWDLREWLARHGASQELLGSAAAQAMYGLMFAYEGGDPKRQRFAAGVAVRFALRMTLAYKGAIFWKMNAGMGDTIFAPIYEVLKARGVRFKFFHKVEQLELDDGGELVERVRLSEQAHTLAGEYRPLVDVAGLPCWPSEPLYDQLVEGEALRAGKVNLESSWAAWDRGTPVVLQRGRDFDDVVLGTSIGPLPTIAAQVLRRHPRWARSVANIATNQTFSVQLWLKPTLAELGWTQPPPALTTYAEQLNTYADMAHLLPRETWPEGQVHDIAYFTAPYPDAATPPSFGDRGFPARMLAALEASALAWLPANIGPLWPAAVGQGGPGTFAWDRLYDPEDRVGPARFAAQFSKINIDPCERYVLSLPGTTEDRLDPERDRQVKNLYPSGDWTRTGLNCGCVESAVMGGMKAARALSGFPHTIVGE